MNFQGFLQVVKGYSQYLEVAKPYLPGIVTVVTLLLLNYLYITKFFLRKIFVDFVVFAVLAIGVSFAGLSWVSYASIVNPSFSTVGSIETLAIVAGVILSVVANLCLSFAYHDPNLR